MVCIVFLYQVKRTSLSSNAKMMGAGKPKIRLLTLMVSVFFSKRQK